MIGDLITSERLRVTVHGNDVRGKSAIDNGPLSAALVCDGGRPRDLDQFSKRKSRVMHSTTTLVIAVSCFLTPAGADTPDAPNHHLRQLRFSPDGRYVLAQDDSSITILTVKPLAVLFRVTAEKARSAGFTPDSQDVVFVSSAQHVERWHVANNTRIGDTEVTLPPCKTAALSLDGRAMACVDSEGTVGLVDLVSNEVRLWKKKLVT